MPKVVQLYPYQFGRPQYTVWMSNASSEAGSVSLADGSATMYNAKRDDHYLERRQRIKKVMVIRSVDLP